METKNCIGASCKAVDDTGTALIAFATLGAIDHDGDYLFADSIGRKTTRLQPAHDWKAPAMGVAKTFEQDSEARANVLFNLKMESGREWHQSILGNFRSGLTQEWSFAYDVLEDDPKFARSIGAKRAFRKLDIHEISPVLKGAGINTRTLEVKRCLTCGSEQPRIEQPKAHCSCGAKANGAGDLAAVFMADLLTEVKALRSEVAALTAPRVRHGGTFDDPDFARRVLARVAATDGRRNGRSYY